MENHKKTPANTLQLDTEVLAGASETESHADRITRYSGGRSRALQMLDYLDDLPDVEYQTRYGPRTRKQAPPQVRSGLRTCANYLHFHEYYTIDKIRLANAQFCKQHLICPLCAMRRGTKSLNSYLERFNIIKAAQPRLKLCMVTFTVKNGECLEERFKHLTGTLKRLMRRRTSYNNNVRGAKYSELCKVQGGVYSIETTNIGNGWHPHLHMLCLVDASIAQHDLRNEWYELSGDSFEVKVDPIKGDPVQGFMEVFKYAVKFSDLSLEQNWHAAQILKGKRLLNAFGLFRGVEVPEELTDELLEDLPYWDRFYRFAFGHYQITGERPPQQPPANA